MIKYVSTAVVVLVVLGFAIAPNYRWLAINGIHAKARAESMREGGVSSCDWFSHGIVSSSAEAVTFSEHGGIAIYAYSPGAAPESSAGLKWVNIYGPWYVASIKT